MAKNVLQKRWNGTAWEEIHPVTTGTNVILKSGKSVEEEISGLNQTQGYGVTTNSGNAYAVTIAKGPTTLAEGVRVAVKINADSTGASTLNVNGLGAKAIKKANGNDVTNLKKDSVYTLVYNGVAFTLQGEGGEIGTATAPDVREGKTIGGDTLVTGTLPVMATAAQSVTPGKDDIVKDAGIYDGAITIKGVPVPADKVLTGTTIAGTPGTMPDRGAGGTVTPGTTNQTKDAGYYGTPITILGDPDLIPGNFPKDVNLFGVQGILERLTTTDKTAIASQISGKGVAASVNDTPAVLAAKIGQIYQGKRYIELSLGDIGPSGSRTADFGFIPSVIMTFAKSVSTGTNYQVGSSAITPNGSTYINTTGDNGVRPVAPFASNMSITNFTGGTMYDVIVRAWG